MNSNSGWTSTFGPQEHTHVPVFWFHICAFVFPEALRKRNLFHPPLIHRFILPVPPAGLLTRLHQPQTEKWPGRCPDRPTWTGTSLSGTCTQRRRQSGQSQRFSSSWKSEKHSCRAPLKQSNKIYNKMERDRNPRPTTGPLLTAGWCKAASCIYRIFTKV